MRTNEFGIEMIKECTEKSFCFLTDDKGFNTRFNFNRIVEETPSVDVAKMIQGKTIAVHLHLFYINLLSEIIGYLNNIPYNFDIFVSVPAQVECNIEKVKVDLSSIEYVHNVTIERTPNRGRDIAPMLCTFNERLQKYDFLLHIHTKKSPHESSLKYWRQYILGHLLHNKDSVSYIMQLLATDTGMVAAPDFLLNEENEWAQNLKLSQDIINMSSRKLILTKEVPTVKFPQGNMFWCQTHYLDNFFSLRLKYEDFPSEPLPVDGSIAHALERLFFLWNTNPKKKCCMMYHDIDEIYLRQQAEDEYYNLRASFSRKYKKYRGLTFIFAISTFILFLYIIVNAILCIVD